MNDTLNIHDYHLGQIKSYQRVKIDLKNPTRSMINLIDIATGLGNICRFGGQIKPFYSVAQHSCVVMALAPEWLRKEALLHDASEAYLGDVIKPLKHMLGEVYKLLESHLEAVIFKKYGLNIDHLPQIKEYDRRALEMEEDYRMGGNELHSFLFAHYGNPMFWTPEQAVTIYRRQLVEKFNDIIE
jgi:DNA-directed RNA polymerase subunit H (RpoH/RPB5)